MERELDETDWQLLSALQENARLTFSDLGRRVGLSSPAVAERVRRMEEEGIISGYHADINVAKVGLPINAIVRFGSRNGDYKRAAEVASRFPGVIECHEMTGRDCLIIKAVVPSIDQLKVLLKSLEPYGETETGLILASPVARRSITRSMWD